MFTQNLFFIHNFINKCLKFFCFESAIDCFSPLNLTNYSPCPSSAFICNLLWCIQWNHIFLCYCCSLVLLFGPDAKQFLLASVVISLMSLYLLTFCLGLLENLHYSSIKQKKPKNIYHHFMLFSKLCVYVTIFSFCGNWVGKSLTLKWSKSYSEC